MRGLPGARCVAALDQIDDQRDDEQHHAGLGANGMMAPPPPAGANDVAHPAWSLALRPLVPGSGNGGLIAACHAFAWATPPLLRAGFAAGPFPRCRWCPRGAPARPPPRRGAGRSAPAPPCCETRGRPTSYTSLAGRATIDHLWRYDHLGGFRRFFQKRIGPLCSRRPHSWRQGCPPCWRAASITAARRARES